MDTPLNGPAEECGADKVHESRLHRAIVEKAALLPIPSLPDGGLFESFFIGGFECSTHRRRDGRQLDLVAATNHDTCAPADYCQLAEFGIRTLRDGLRWHLIEQVPGRYDWSSFLPQLRASMSAKTQVIWDLCHWGWPEHIDIWSPAFADRFARFAKAAAQLVHDEGEAHPLYVPVNEISFWAWAGGDLELIGPCAPGRGLELKTNLVRASIAAIEAVRSVNKDTPIVFAEPAIHVVPRSEDPTDIVNARTYSAAQFEALDWISGRDRPELGGRAEFIDVVGVNYYLHNQWVDGELPLAVDDPRYRPFRRLLQDVHERYSKPLIVAETGIEGDLRSDWLRIMGTEVAAAREAGVPVEGLCLYPITDYPGWEDERLCPTGLLGIANSSGRRTVESRLAAELHRQCNTIARQPI